MKYQEYEAAVIANAEKFVAANFTGRGTYERTERNTQADAELAARAMINRRPANDTFNKGRPVLVYAVRGNSEVLAKLVYP